ncbi:MAG: hypothetical protein DRI57_07975 [Deltaproteobacteria bacterium]|nr:MAG: hypothetical protein DRI57_07975 [Deltaproteobacteria bacterium]
MSFFFVIIKKRTPAVGKPACERSVRTHRSHALRHGLPGDAGGRPRRKPILYAFAGTAPPSAYVTLRTKFSDFRRSWASVLTEAEKENALSPRNPCLRPFPTAPHY